MRLVTLMSLNHQMTMTQAAMMNLMVIRNQQKCLDLRLNLMRIKHRQLKSKLLPQIHLMKLQRSMLFILFIKM